MLVAQFKVRKAQLIKPAQYNQNKISTINRNQIFKEKVQSQNVKGVYEPSVIQSAANRQENQLLMSLKNSENQISILQDSNQQYIIKILNYEEKLKQANMIIVSQEKKIKDQSEEIHHWLQHIKQLEEQTKKYKEKKKILKQQKLQLQQQMSQTSQQSGEFAQLMEMRHVLQALRLQVQLIPLIQQQNRLRQYQNQMVDIDNMNYEQLLELEEQIGYLKTVSHGLSREDIKKIPKRIICQSDIISELCTVCQCNMQVNEKYRKLSCNHLYHSKCIKSWLLQHNNCPLCKAEVIIS